VSRGLILSRTTFGKRSNVLHYEEGNILTNDSAALPFPQAAEAVGVEWARYQAEAENLTRQGVSVEESESAVLKQAITLLPEYVSVHIAREVH
jgi:hypothetical protein